MGFIYLITNKLNGRQYVGQTRKQIHLRWTAHQRDARYIGEYLADPENYKKKLPKTYLHKCMNEDGAENFQIQQLLEVELDRLDDEEIRLIREYNTLKPNGYNLTTGGKHYQFGPDFMKIICSIENLDKWRSEDTKGLPAYIIRHNKGGLQGFAINNHRFCSYKAFTTTKGRTKEECKQLALDFLRELEAKGEKFVIKRKADETLPVGITKFRDGYKVRRKINGEWKMKVFMGVKKSDEEKLNAAKVYLAEINAVIQ